MRAEGRDLRVTARVTNTSARAGDEVVQLYVSGPARGATDPIRELKEFTRLHLRGGESRDVSFVLARDALPNGRATISVGGGQPLAGVPHVIGIR